MTATELTTLLGVMTALLLGVYGTGEPGIRVMIRATPFIEGAA